MKTIDNVREELERGYILTISGVGAYCYGVIMLRPHEYLVQDCSEVEVSDIMKNMPNILKEISKYQTICQISYDYETRKVLGQIKKAKTEGTYCEARSYETTTEVRSDDIYMALIELNEKIAENKNTKDKDKSKTKVKKGE